MSIPTLTLRTLKNRNSGIDIAVPSVQETEAPLGGTSVEYEIAIATNLPFFKTRLHSSKDVVQFSVYKAYREVEDLYVRLQKKFSLPDLPPIPHGNKILACSTQEKQKALENFFMFIAQKADICSSSSFTQFVGISSQKHEVSLQNEKTSQKKSVLDVETKHNEDANEKEEKSFLEEIWPTEKEKASLTITSEIDLFNSAEKIIAENARRKSDLECAPDLYPVIVSDPLQNELCESIEEKGDDSNVVFLSKNNSVDEDDLFEEVKRQKETRNKETQISENNQKSYRGLFDDIDDGRSDLFAKLSGVHVSKDTGSDNVLEEADKLFVPTKLSAVELGSSDFGNSFMRETNSDKGREGKTLGDISLFEEQDFGNAITIDEESLFLITETDDDKIKKKNPLLFSKLESSTTIKDESSEIVESLDDLLDMAPLPEASASSRKRHQFDSSANQLPDVKKEPSLPEIVLKVSSSSEERIELIQPEVKMEPTLADVKTEPTLAAIKTEHTLAVIETGPTLASVKPETTPAELIPEPAPAELIQEPTPAELIQEPTPAELKTESIIAEVRKKPSPPEIKKKPSPAEFKKEPPPPYPKSAHPSRPVPMPRKNPIPPKLVGTKPEVQPRTVFLSKPSLPPKPVPPPKPKPNRNSLKGNLKMSDANDKSNDPTSKSLAGVHKQVDNATGELSSVDLLQYIENEKKSSSNANLFD